MHDQIRGLNTGSIVGGIGLIICMAELTVKQVLVVQFK
jgi:hypothetical protein